MDRKQYNTSIKKGYFSLPVHLESSLKLEEPKKKRLTRQRRSTKDQDNENTSPSNDNSPENLTLSANNQFDNSEELAFFQACEQKLKRDQCHDQEMENSSNSGTDSSPTYDTLARYIEACELTNTCPLSTFIRQIGRRVIRIRNSLMRPAEIKAVCIALLTDETVEHVDISGNDVDASSVRYITQLVSHNPGLMDLTARDNLLSGTGLDSLLKTMRMDECITRLDLSGNNLKDKDSHALAFCLTNNKVLEYLNLSNNELSELAGKLLGNSIDRNTTLRELDLSWNHLRHRGAVDIAKAMKHNGSLVRLNVDWNGFGYEGAAAMGKALGCNNTLLELDIAYNRIHNEGLLQLCRGLLNNKTLEFLRLSHNPLWSIHLQVLICGIRDTPQMALKHLDLSGLVVESEFMDVTREIQKRSTFSVIHGRVLPRCRALGQLQPFLNLENAFDMDPPQVLQFLKDKMRVVDLFWNIDHDRSETITRGELHEILKDAGVPVTAKIVHELMRFMDTGGDGEIDMSEFIDADRRSRKKLMMRRKQVGNMKHDKYTQFTEAYRDLEFSAQTRDTVRNYKSQTMVQNAMNSLHADREGL